MKTTAFLTSCGLLFLLLNSAAAQSPMASPQHVAVDQNALQDFFIRFPDDVIVTYCTVSNLYGEPVLFGNTCPDLNVSYQDFVFGISDVCFTITREWSIENGCADSSATAFVHVPNPTPNPTPMDPSNFPGPVLSACDAPAPWNPTIVKKNWMDTAVTNYCSFWEQHPKVYRYNQLIRVIDWNPPVITDCPAGQGVFIDSTQNDPALWSDVYDPGLPPADLFETEADLGIDAFDDCTGEGVGIEFELFLDLDNDGMQESVVTRFNEPSPGHLRYNNINNAPNYMGGAVVAFDKRQLPANQQWKFICHETFTDSDRHGFLRWTTTQDPDTRVLPQLPRGTHRIKWTVTDGCANTSTCEHSFTIREDAATALLEVESQGFILYQNEPNPFRETTNIRFHLPRAAETEIAVYDLEGRKLFNQKGPFEQGLHTVPLETECLKSPGVFYYKLESGQQVAWRKMVFLR